MVTATLALIYSFFFFVAETRESWDCLVWVPTGYRVTEFLEPLLYLTDFDSLTGPMA